MRQQRKKKVEGRPATAFVPGVVIDPPSTIRCEACSVHENLGVGLPLFEPARQVEFNRGVESFLAAHRGCFDKEGK